ncbi:MAG: OsmC family protein [Bacteroidota bacterium]
MTKHAVLKQLDGIAFAAKGDSNHWVMMDGPESVGGTDAGSRPKELVLYALAGCTASDVVSILKKKHVALQGFEMHLTGREAEEHPRVFTDIHVEYVFFGEDIRPADVERAIELSTTKYCSVSAMLTPKVKITHSYRIEPSRIGAKSDATSLANYHHHELRREPLDANL